MKRIVMLAMLVLGTAAFANAKPVAAKGTTAKEISIRKHRKAVKRAKTAQTPKPVASTAKNKFKNLTSTAWEIRGGYA